MPRPPSAPRDTAGDTQPAPPSARRGELAIVLAAVLFGSTFVIIKDAVTSAEPVPFLSVRFLIAGLVLLPLARRRPAAPGLLPAAFWCALALGGGYVFQTVGVQYTSSSVNAFVTYLFVVMVPVMSAVFLRHRPSPATGAGVVVATGGLILLAGGPHSFGRGEWLTLGCAVCFAVHVVLLSHFSPMHDTWRLSCAQLLMVGAMLLLPGVVTGGYDLPAKAWAAAAYTAVAASAGALSLQIWGQRLIGPSRTALLLMLEPVSAAVLGYLVGDRLGVGGVVGALLILGGIAVAEVFGSPATQLPDDPVPSLD
ncbi:MAG TPA: DMT family transporter [Acidimicrobiales bacterium]|nr:DMT family transporter [Acidimicrobiales bacterium]